MQQMYTPKQNYKVLVRCITYNQSKYIVDCLNGFAMQKTTFPFVCLIMDDCSTDGEIEVIKTWMEQECDISKAEYVDLKLSTVILVPHRINEHCRFAFYLLKRNLYKEKNLKMYLVKPWRDHCEYEAFCEGDDYWTHPHKLQKQVDWLDSNPNFGLVYGHTKVQDSRGTICGSTNYSETKLEKLLVTGYVPTCTVVYRLDAYKRYIDEVNLREKKWLQGDLPLVLWFAAKTRIHCFDEDFGVYRIVPGSASHSFSVEKAKRMRESELNVRLFFDKTYSGGRLNSEIYDWYYRIIFQIALYKERAIKNAIDIFFKISHKKSHDYILLFRGILSNIKYNIRNKKL